MTAPETAPPPPALDLDDRLRMAGRVAQFRIAGTTPGRMRVWSVALLVLSAIGALIAWNAASSLVDGADRAEQNTAPALVAVQDVVASIAEADAAAAAVFLSGADEDREQRRLYEVALARASAQLEEVARLVGDDDLAHDALKAIGAQLPTYAGLVEAARVANRNNIVEAAELLLDAIDVIQSGIVPQVEVITTRAGDDLDADADTGRLATVAALGWFAVVLLALVLAQTWLRRRTNRILDLPLLAGTLLIVVAAVWLLIAWNGRQNEFDRARTGGYDSIVLTSDIQRSAFRYKTLESLALLGEGSTSEQDLLATDLIAVDVTPELVARAREGRASGDGDVLEVSRRADSTRERAASAELLERWRRYRVTSLDIRQAIAGAQRDAAIELATGAGNSDFNGFNTAVESVLSDNRTQFFDGIGAARDRLSMLSPAMVLLPLVAAILTLWGFQRRIREYNR